MRRWALVGLAAVCGIALSACTDPLAGSWRTGKRDCDRRGHMTLDSDWAGQATSPIGCDRTCRMDVNASSAGGDLYEYRVTVTTPDTCVFEGGGTKGKYGCRLMSDGAELDCDDFGRWLWQGD